MWLRGSKVERCGLIGVPDAFLRLISFSVPSGMARTKAFCHDIYGLLSGLKFYRFLCACLQICSRVVDENRNVVEGRVSYGSRELDLDANSAIRSQRYETNGLSQPRGTYATNVRINTLLH